MWWPSPKRGLVTSCEITSAAAPDGPTGVGMLKDDVSILTRPEGRVPFTATRLANQLILVSILTRPEGRVPCDLLDRRAKAGGHVSILTRPEGRVP